MHVDMDLSTERDYPQCAIRTDNATAVVREQSCFPMVELSEALDIVEGEVRTAVHMRLRQLSYSRTSRVNIAVCREGDTSQPTQTSKYHTRHKHFPGEKDFIGDATRAFHSATGKDTTEGSNRHCLDADSADNEHCLVETVIPPFLGRRIGSPNGVSAPFALPPFRASLVDGYALHIPLGKWREVQQVYKKTSPQQTVERNAYHNSKDRVALKITGEVRAGADLTRESLQPFRGHPHIWEGISRGGASENRTLYSLENRTEHTERSAERRSEEVPITLQCVYVTTGSPVPTWCNAVVPVESCEVDIENCLCWPDQEALLKITGDGYNIREVGSDAQAESLLLQQGQLVGPAEEGILAAVGLERLEVFRKLNVHTLALGDELQSRGVAGTLKKEVSKNGVPQSEYGCSRDRAQNSSTCDNNGDAESRKMQQKSISATHETQSTSAAVYDSNSPMLKALLSQHCPSTYVGQHHVLLDDVDEVQRLLLALALKEPTLPQHVAGPVQRQSHWTGDSESALHECCADILVSTGGVSMGGSDCMKLALLRLHRKTLQHHPNLQINARCREHFAQQKTQRGSPYAEAASATPTPNRGDRTDVSTGISESPRRVPADIGKEALIASTPDAEPPAARDWSHTVETEIKFGRLNMKPGKPAMFAVLRVFPRHPKRGESDGVEEAKEPLPFEEVVDGTPALQAKSPHDTSDTFLGRGHNSRYEISEKSDSTSNSASSNVEQPLSSSEKLCSQRRTRRPVRVLLVFALPGNPCSAWVLFHLLVAPALNFYSSFCPSASLSTHVPAQMLAILDEPIVPDSTRPEYQRALVYVGQSENKTEASDSDGRLSAEESQSFVGDWSAPAHAAHPLHAFPTGVQTSSRLLSCCASANGLILVPPSKVSKRLCIPAGETVPVLLCGALFSVRPTSLIDLLRLQNKVSGFYKTRCRCGGGSDSSENALSSKTKNVVSIDKRIPRTDEATGEFDLPSVSSLVDVSGTSASHFKRSQSVGDAVNLGVIIVSDRCFSGEMRDACADTLLGVLQQSSATAALLQLASHWGQKNKSSVRAEDDTAFANGHTWDTAEKQRGRIRIVPDQIESIQEAVFSMMCTCANKPEALLRTDADPSSRRSLIFVCGGTGLSPRDVTPQALLPLFTLRCSGIEHLLLEYSLRCTPLAALGRPCAGVIECGASRQMRQVKANGTNSVSSRGICPSAPDKRKFAQTPLAVRSPLEDCRTHTVSRRSREPLGFDSVASDECCRRNEADALRKFKDNRCTTKRENVPPFGKGTTVAREISGSTGAPFESAIAGELATVAGGRVEVSRQRSGCGARCMVVVFPGSPKAVKENATALLPVLPHALEQL